MMTQKVDRRVRRTRHMLSQALLSLIQEEAYEAITIQAITDRADLNRATFYLHYGSKEELLIASLEAMFDELVSTFDEATVDRPIWGSKTAELLTFQHVAEHAALYKVLLGERGMGYIVYRIINYIADFSYQQLTASLAPGTKLPVPAAIINHHIAGSTFALLSWWLEQDMPYSPAYMADVVHTLCVHGTLPLIDASQMGLAVNLSEQV
jgi:AcrR family transcriptional regulator